MKQFGISHNSAKAKLEHGEHVFGTWVSDVRTPSIIRMIAAAGFETVTIDTEHTSLSFETVGDLCQMARACGITPIVRTYDKNPALVNRFQDIGAMGILYPHVTRRDEVDLFLETMLYPPAGRRGTSSRSGATDYMTSGIAEKQYINDNVALEILIEDISGVEAIDDILKGGGITAVSIGRNDLSSDYGVPYQVNHPNVVAAVDHVIARCTEAGVAVGTICLNMNDATDLIQRGMRNISYSSDRVILLHAYQDAIKKLREITSRPAH